MTASLRLRATLALFVSCATAAFTACGGSGASSDAPGGPGATSGLAGASGGAGKSGAAGKGASGSSGQAGSAATGGKGGGASGAAGSAQAGQAGASGAAGKGAAGAGAGGASGAAGKGAGGGSSGSGGTSSAGAAGKSGAAGAAGSSQGMAVGLVISPLAVNIDVKNGVSAPQQLVAKPVYSDGSVGTPISTATWSILPGDRATVSATGLVTATGNIGGAAVVTAKWMSLSATADVTVKLYDTANVGGLTPVEQAGLDGAVGADPGAQWIYPYNATTFPRGLDAPAMMWNGFAAGDLIKVSMISQFVDVEAYFKPSGPVVAVPPDAWTHLTESGKGGPVQVKVSRTSGGASKIIMQHTWTTGSGSLRGTVYYWSNNLGRVVRIKPGAKAPDDFLAAAGVTDGCTTCHAVNANGSVLTIGGGSATGDSAASVFDLLGGTLVAKDRGRAWAMLALSPDGKYAALNNAPLPGGPGLNGGLYDVATGGKVPGTGADGELFDMPAFAPDGSKLVYVDHGTKGLVAMTYNQGAGTPQLANKTPLISASGDPNTSSIAFPSVSPDGKWAVYHHGNLDTRNGPGDLYLASTTQPGVEIPLDALNGSMYPFFYGARDLHYNYEPTFAPVAAGGYFWVVFTSRRTYGNQLIDVPSNTKQIWVAAIDLNPTPGKDPSHPAFWVSGQDPNTWNMRAFWALDPCKDDGASCSASSQCCGGVCQSNNTCGEPPGQTCKPVGATCMVASDCCNADQGFMCINSHCTEAKPLARPARAIGLQATGYSQSESSGSPELFRLKPAACWLTTSASGCERARGERRLSREPGTT